MDLVIIATAVCIAVASACTAAVFFRRARLAESLATQLREDIQVERIAAGQDPLTGLLNHRGFLELTSTVLSDQRARPLVVVVVDAWVRNDYLKFGNGQNDQLIGDEILIALGRRVADYTIGGAVARLEGNMFAALLIGPFEADVMNYPHAREITQMLAEPILISGSLVRVSTSVGVANVDSSVDVGKAMRHMENAIRRTGRPQPLVPPRAPFIKHADERPAIRPVHYRSRVVALHYRRS